MVKIPGPVEYLLRNVFFPGLWCCTPPILPVQAEFRWKIRKIRLKKLGGFHGFPRACNPICPQKDAEPVPPMDNKMKMLCSGMCLWWSTGRTECPRHQQISWSWSRAVAQTPQTRQSPAHANSAQTSCSSVLLLHFCFLSRISGQEYRHPVLNKKRAVALVHPLSKIEKAPFNEIYHIMVAFLSIHRKGSHVLHS